MNYYVVTELNQVSKNGTQVSTILSINTATAHQSQKLSILFNSVFIRKNYDFEGLNQQLQKNLTTSDTIRAHIQLTIVPFQYKSVFENIRIYFSHFQYEDHVKLIQYKNFLQYRYNIIHS